MPAFTGTKYMMEYIYLDWYLLLLPAAFIHGWFVGRHHGVKKGAAEMFDHLYERATPVSGKRYTRTIEISLDE